ncbi:MAG: peptidoglycan endopeptidase [Chloroflexi bacterium]|nr:peptidoglycan endopeptidase [Chloroflexota bacterium]
MGSWNITPSHPSPITAALVLAPARLSDDARPSLTFPALFSPVVPVPIEESGSDAASGINATAADVLATAGTVATIPGQSIEVATADAPTLRDVASRYQVDAAVLAAYNGLSLATADEAFSKKELSLPVGVIEVASLKLREDLRPATPEMVAYTIAPGDTLLDIALRFRVDPGLLVAANGLASPDVIHAGNQLQLAARAGPAQTTFAASAPAVAAPAINSEPAPSAAGAALIDSLVEPVRAPAPTTYEVAPGDTVSELAERFGVDTDTIVGTNSLNSADSIRIGDQLTILPVSGVMHTVRQGQTLSEVAALYRVDLGPIIDFNYIDDADLIIVGKELIVPGGRPLPAALARTAAIQYQISPGDTLSSIAIRFGVTSGLIAQSNSLANPDRLSIGSSLTIPGGAAVAQALQQVITRNLPVLSASSPSVNLPFPTSGAGGDLASIAMRYLGSRYVFGGTTPSGFDCSGLVYYVQAQLGSPVSRGMWGQYAAGPHPSRDQLLPGDIVFFQNTYMAGLSHNGIYIGGGQFVNAVDERSGVKISNLNESYWASRWFGATRAW